VSTPGICGGRPLIDGHRIQVEDVAIWHERMGMSPDQIVSEYPSLTLADVHAALAYYSENRERIDAEIEAAKKYAEEMRANTRSQSARSSSASSSSGRFMNPRRSQKGSSTSEDRQSEMLLGFPG
jgi:uncharacterized protein (DUF433 family)